MYINIVQESNFKIVLPKMGLTSGGGGPPPPKIIKKESSPEIIDLDSGPPFNTKVQFVLQYYVAVYLLPFTGRVSHGCRFFTFSTIFNIVCTMWRDRLMIFIFKKSVYRRFEPTTQA